MRILRCLTDDGRTVYATEGEMGRHHLLSGTPWDGFTATSSPTTTCLILQS